MSKYQLSAIGGIIRIADNATIPEDDSNTDYAAYLAWVAAGGVPDPAPTPPPVLREITAYAFMMRFTAGERSAIRAATAVNEDLADLYDRQRAAQTINLDDAEVIAALDTLTTAGILAAGRKAEILT